ncbi:MAG: acyl-CoA dehydrogenase [Candidatus Hecatellales archaeon]|nr:MAG: acyl-CoA dehydrogenase [Candidatus Hecatellales archaeon]
MDFELDEAQKSVQKIMREFTEREVIPLAEEIDRKQEIPLQLMKKLADIGYFGMRYPEKYGGTGLDTVSECIAIEELARGSLSVAFAATMQAFQCTDFIYLFGSEEQKQEWLVPAIKGEKFGAFCLTEPGGGSDLSMLKTTVRVEGDECVINGTKTFVTNGPMADWYITAVMAVKEKGFWGIDFVVVPKGTPGLIIGKNIPKSGLRGVKNCELMYDECRVPLKNALAGIGEGKGGAYLQGILAEIRLITGALGLGLTQAALDVAVEYAGERVAFGQPISRWQGISFKIATIATELEAARVFLYYAAWLMSKKIKEVGAFKGRMDPQVVKISSMAKNFACELAQRAVDEAMRIHGGYSMSEEMPVNRLWRDAGGLLWGGGTTEINNIIIVREIYRERKKR